MESQEFMTAIDEAVKGLDEAIAAGNAYITEVSPIIRHELETQQGGKPIDAAYVAPVIGGANSLKGAVGGTEEMAAPAASDVIGELGLSRPGLVAHALARAVRMLNPILPERAAPSSDYAAIDAIVFLDVCDEFLGCLTIPLFHPMKPMDWVDTLGPVVMGALCGVAVAAYVAARRGTVRAPS